MKILLALVLCAPAWAAKTIELKALARVAGVTVTDRQVLLDTVLEKPALYRAGEKLSSAEAELGLQRLLTQHMVNDENKVLLSTSADEREIVQRLNTFKSALGRSYTSFMREWDVKEAELREHIRQKIIVQKIIDGRVKSALSEFDARSQNEKKGNDWEQRRQARARAALEEWFAQLRTRYRVIRLQ